MSCFRTSVGQAGGHDLPDSNVAIGPMSLLAPASGQRSVVPHEEKEKLWLVLASTVCPMPQHLKELVENTSKRTRPGGVA
jgi:hypothetical protein